MATRLAILCELHKRNLLPGAPCFSFHVPFCQGHPAIRSRAASSSMAHGSSHHASNHTTLGIVSIGSSSADAAPPPPRRSEMRSTEVPRTIRPIWGPSVSMRHHRSPTPKSKAHRIGAALRLRRGRRSGRGPGLAPGHDSPRGPCGLASAGLRAAPNNPLSKTQKDCHLAARLG